MTPQPNTSNPDVTAALATLLGLQRDSRAEVEAVQARAQREYTTPFSYPIAPPAPEQAAEYVMLLLRADPNAQGAIGFVRTVAGVYLADGTEGMRFDLSAGVPAFVPARFVREGFAQRELTKLHTAGLLVLQPGPSFALDQYTAELYGKWIGRVAVGGTQARLDAPRPTITEDECERAAALVAPTHPALAEALVKLAQGTPQVWGTFCANNVKDVGGGQGLSRRVGWGELSRKVD